MLRDRVGEAHGTCDHVCMQVIGCLEIISFIGDRQQYVKGYHSPAVPNIRCAGLLLRIHFEVAILGAFVTVKVAVPQKSSKIYSSRVKRKVSL